MGVVRHIMPRDFTTRPAGASSHAPPALRLVERVLLRADGRRAAAATEWPWRGIVISSFIHVALLATIVWMNAGAPPAASVAVEMVFWPAPSAAPEGESAEPASGAVQAVAMESPVEPVPESTEAPAVAAEPETIAAEEPVEVSPPVEVPPTETDPMAAAATEMPAEPPPRVLESVTPESPEMPVDPLPIETAMADAPEAVAAVEPALPPPPPPRPAVVRAKAIEPKPHPQAAPPPPPPQAAAVLGDPKPPEAPRTPAPVETASVADVAAAEQSSAQPGAIPVIREPRFRRPPAPPHYPARAVDRNQQGTVIVRALVGADGTSNEIVIWRSSGYALLDEAALRAVRRWAFEPASAGGRQIAAWVEVPVRFHIR